MPSRDEVIREQINAIGVDSFPDDVAVTWQVRSTVHTGEYSFVEAAPEPPTVGYERFRFVLRFEGDAAPVTVGCYCWDRGRWTLLFTTPDTPSDWQRLTPPG